MQVVENGSMQRVIVPSGLPVDAADFVALEDGLGLVK
jgi:hypothetical protein